MRHILAAVCCLFVVGFLQATSQAAPGHLSWSITFPVEEAPYFVRIDNAANIVVVGRYYEPSPEVAQVFVRKYRRDSTEVWSAITTGADLKIPIAASLDQNGNVYVLAQYEPSTHSPVILYRFGGDDGLLDWQAEYNPPGSYRQTAVRDLFVTPDGRSVVCANFVIDDLAHPHNSDMESFLLVYDVDGNLVQAETDFFSQPSVSFERVKSNGTTIFVTTSLVTDSGDYDGYVAGYDFNADSLWVHCSGLDRSSGVFLQGVALDSAGNNFVAFANSDSTSFRKYDPAGNVLFTAKSVSYSFPYQNELAADPDGNVYYMVGDLLGNQRLQKRNVTGSLVLDTVLGSGFIPFPVVYSLDGSILTWNPEFRAAQYTRTGAELWRSDEVYATHGDFAGAATGETYWILLEYTADPFVLLRKLVKYDLGGVCGDADRSGRIDISDAVYMVNYIFAGGRPPADPAEGDYDCNGRTDVSDIVHLINYFFAGGAAPCAACE